jgi:hypothetical protein
VSYPSVLVSAAWVNSLTNGKNPSAKIIKNWGVAARCCGGPVVNTERGSRLVTGAKAH